MIILNEQAIVAMRLAISQASLYPGTDKAAAKFSLVASVFLAVACEFVDDTKNKIPQGSMVYRDFQTSVSQLSRTLDRMTRSPFDPRVIDEELVQNYRQMLKIAPLFRGILICTGQKGFKVPAAIGDWISDINTLLELSGIVIEIDMTDNRAD